MPHDLSLQAHLVRTGCYFVSLILVLSLIHYPGWFNADGMGQFRQSLAGEYHDWHPPLLSFLWRQFYGRTGEFGTLFLFQAITCAAGIALLVTALFRSHWKALSLALALLIWPPIFSRYAMLSKDMITVAFALLAIGAVAQSRLITQLHLKRSLQGLALVSAIMASAFRHEFSIALPPILVLAFWDDLRLRFPKHRLSGMSGGLALSAILLLVSSSLLNSAVGLFGPLEQRHHSQQHELHDLAAISIDQGKVLIPEAFLKKGTGLEEIAEHYSPTLSDRLMFRRHEPLRLLRDEDALQELKSVWIREVTRHPIIYLRHWFATYLRSLGLNKTFFRSPLENFEGAKKRIAEEFHASIPNSERYIYQPNAFLRNLYEPSRSFDRTSIWDPVWAVLAGILCLALLLLAWIRKWIEEDAALLLASLGAVAALHNLAIFLFGPGYVPRYFLISQVAAVVLSVYLVPLVVARVWPAFWRLAATRWGESQGG